MTAPAATRVVAPGTYTIDAHDSRIEFTTRHMFGLARVRGKVDITGGEIRVADDPERSSVRATAGATSFSTRNPMRDVQVRGRFFLHAKRHPTMYFTSTSLVHTADASVLHGILDVKGVEAPLTLTITELSESGGALTATATGTVDRYEHGVRAMPGMAARHLDIAVRVTARRAD